MRGKIRTDRVQFSGCSRGYDTRCRCQEIYTQPLLDITVLPCFHVAYSVQRSDKSAYHFMARAALDLTDASRELMHQSNTQTKGRRTIPQASNTTPLQSQLLDLDDGSWLDTGKCAVTYAMPFKRSRRSTIPRPRNQQAMIADHESTVLHSRTIQVRNSSSTFV